METQEASDYHLIKRYLDGDDFAFELLYSRYRSKLYWYLYRILSCVPNEVDDIFEECWIKAVKSFKYYRDDGFFMAYLQKIAKNIVIDRARKLKRSGVMISLDNIDAPDFPDGNASAPDFELNEQEKKLYTKRLLACLPEEQKKVIEYRMKNYSFKMIAELEKCSINTVLARMSYAKKKLQNLNNLQELL